MAMKNAQLIADKMRAFVRGNFRVWVSMQEVDLLTRQRLHADPELSEVTEAIVAAMLKALGTPHAGGRPPKVGGSGL